MLSLCRINIKDSQNEMKSERRSKGSKSHESIDYYQDNKVSNSMKQYLNKNVIGMILF